MVDANITSPEDPFYNCIAWAVHDDKNWWEPDPMNLSYWPSEAPRRYSVDAYVKAYETLGYEVCDNLEVESGYEKIVLYKNNFDRPTHASRRISSDKWTSKLGPAFDVEHPFFNYWDDLLLKPDNILAGTSIYGCLAKILRKKIS